MSDLKPCPFCGEPADGRYQRLAKCCNDKCLMNEWVEDDTLFYLDEAWNNRPIEDELRKRIAELEAGRIEWVFEDQLPDGIPDAVYSAMYACSEVDFVRVFPSVTVDGRKRFLIELPEVKQ